ncbi:L-alanine-DL-glutamate epimerase [Bacteroidales bacterium 6E]|nr:L-alanine-DL-glutamate epimerase [Bacteroidales bacterium 6E]
MQKRRDFLKYTGMAAGSFLISATGSGCGGNSSTTSGSKLELTFRPYDLQLKHVFTLAGNSRTTTPVVITQLSYDGFIGYGEASLPPYLEETQDSVMKFLASLDLEQFHDPFLLEEIMDYVFNVAPGNYAAKAAVDIALHDLVGKLVGQPLYRLWGLNPENTPDTSFTIGIDEEDVVRTKVKEAEEYNILKVKLGRENDREMISTVRSVTQVPLCVDVNQGWTDRLLALDMIYWLKEQGVVFVEQPMPKELLDDIAWLTQNSPLPVIADEAVQTREDVLPLYGVYSGINIKLMKCGGLKAAREMVTLANAMKMEIMVGCMTETSCAVSAASQLSPMARWGDLDGNLLISNDIFDGVKVIGGKVILPDRPGIGVNLEPGNQLFE